MNEEKTEIPWPTVLTLVLWTTTCSISIVGVMVPYARPAIEAKKETVITAETLQVQLTAQPILEMANELPQISAPQPPELASIVQPLETPSFTAVADPRVVAFALPVEGPVQTVEPKLAAYAAPSEPVQTNKAVRSMPAPRQLTYGQGDGRQPAPEYPYRARREGQEGTVKVRFLVGEDGRVLSAEAVSPSPWPVLNDSALRVVRERWRFRAGDLRNYEVAIRFQLTR